MLLDVSEITKFYKHVENVFTDWAHTQEHIRAAVVVGSRARKNYTADQWSDLDLVIFSTTPALLIESEDWISQFGTPIITFLEPTASGGRERRVLYTNGLDVDFAITPYVMLQQTAEEGVTDELARDTANVYQRGYRIIIDKEKILAKVLRKLKNYKLPPPGAPAEDEFCERVKDFWYHAVWTAKRLRRQELWEAKGGLDSYMKYRCLLPMIEWHTRVKQRSNHDTWFRGRFLEQWADPRIVIGLREAFAHYDEDDMWHALAGSMNLFRVMAFEVAEQLGYTYPKEADQFASQWVDAAYWDREPTE